MRMACSWRRVLAIMCVPVSLLCASWSAGRLWGGDGHKIVAQIAYDNLTGPAKQRVDVLLDGDTLATFSIWADQVQHTAMYSWSAPYHYVDTGHARTRHHTSHTHGNQLRHVSRFQDPREVVTVGFQGPFCRSSA